HRGIPVAEGPAAIDHDGVRGLPEIPPVVGILPRTASHISIAGSYLEFRTEPVGVTSDGRIVVACRVVIEVSEAVAILDQVVRCPTGHMDARIVVARGRDLLEDVVAAVDADPVVRGISQGDADDVPPIGVEPDPVHVTHLWL